MDFDAAFTAQLDGLKSEGNYRIFAELLLEQAVYAPQYSSSVDTRIVESLATVPVTVARNPFSVAVTASICFTLAFPTESSEYLFW